MSNRFARHSRQAFSHGCDFHRHGSGRKTYARLLIGKPMKTTRVTGAVVWALTMLLLAPLDAKAGARGFGIRSSLFGGHHFVRGNHFALARHHFRFFRHRQAFGLWPWYGYYDVPPYTYDDSMTYPTPATVVVRPEPPPAVGCQHSEQTRKVPSENGGTTEVTILRC